MDDDDDDDDDDTFVLLHALPMTVGHLKTVRIAFKLQCSPKKGNALGHPVSLSKLPPTPTAPAAVTTAKSNPFYTPSDPPPPKSSLARTTGSTT